MTDRHIGFTVVLDKEIRSDDAEFIKNAIAAIKHVVEVTPVVEDPSVFITKRQVRYELEQKLLEALR